jgi:hypothetical protein
MPVSVPSPTRISHSSRDFRSGGRTPEDRAGVSRDFVWIGRIAPRCCARFRIMC